MPEAHGFSKLWFIFLTVLASLISIGCRWKFLFWAVTGLAWFIWLSTVMLDMPRRWIKIMSKIPKAILVEEYWEF